MALFSVIHFINFGRLNVLEVSHYVYILVYTLIKQLFHMHYILLYSFEIFEICSHTPYVLTTNCIAFSNFREVLPGFMLPRGSPGTRQFKIRPQNTKTIRFLAFSIPDVCCTCTTLCDALTMFSRNSDLIFVLLPPFIYITNVHKV